MVKESDFTPAELLEMRELAAKLVRHGLEDHLSEVVSIVWGQRPFGGLDLAEWSIDEVRVWTSGLAFLLPERETIVERLWDQCIDGAFLQNMVERDWVTRLGLEYSHFLLLEVILHGWAFGNASLRLPADIDSLGVVLGVAADFTKVDPATAEALVAADERCASSGVGSVYGQLVVLGYKEYRSIDSAVTPCGVANEKFVMRRRRIPNGLKRLNPYHQSSGSAAGPHPEGGGGRLPSLRLVMGPECLTSKELDASAAHSRWVFDFAADPSRDLFQVGRAAHSATNDFVVSGLLHEDADGVQSGPVSRHAARIECERLPPYRCFVFAGGFNQHRELTVNRAASGPGLPYTTDDPRSYSSMDGFSTFGVKLWQPEVDQWLEVSVLGLTYLPRTAHAAVPTQQVDAPLGNQLTNGSLLDLGGVTLLYQSPVCMARALNVNPLSVIASLNALRPQCPVLFNEIHFSFMDVKQRALRAFQGENEAFADLLPYGTLRIPVTDYSAIAEENRSYVFPACGHVHGYHRSMEGKPCPLCRKVGSFVPIAFPFEPSLCDRRPTHVFNPCGHVASHSACDLWSRLRLPSRSLPSQDLRPMCPFCATELVPHSPYTRLILQTERGEMWTGETSLEEDQQARAELQVACHSEEAVEASQALLFRREHVELLQQAAAHSELPPTVGRVSWTAEREALRFPKYFGPTQNENL